MIIYHTGHGNWLWSKNIIILSKDKQIRSVIIQLPNNQLVSKAINHLYPLEIQATQSEDIKNDTEVTNNESVTSGSSWNSWPLRKSADQARKRITEQLNDQFAAVVFSLPRECHGNEFDMLIIKLCNSVYYAYKTW